MNCAPSMKKILRRKIINELNPGKCTGINQRIRTRLRVISFSAQKTGMDVVVWSEIDELKNFNKNKRVPSSFNLSSIYVTVLAKTTTSLKFINMIDKKTTTHNEYYFA